MKKTILTLFLGLLTTIGADARKVQSFCDGWEFQRGGIPKTL